MNPNHYLAVAIQISARQSAGVAGAARRSARRVVSSSMIDRVVAALGRRLCGGAGRLQVVVPRRCSTARVCFGGEESAGASFLRRDGTVWTTDKDGLIMALLAAEITARTGKDPGEHYRELEAQLRRAALHANRRARHAGAEGAAAEALARRRDSDHAGWRADPRDADPRAGEQRADRWPEGRRPRAAGSRRGRPAPRISTRSTRRASGARRTCRRSSARRSAIVAASLGRLAGSLEAPRRRLGHDINLKRRVGRRNVGRLQPELLANDVAALSDGAGLVERDLAVAALTAEAAVARHDQLLGRDVLERGADGVGDLLGAVGLQRAVADGADADLLRQLALVRGRTARCPGSCDPWSRSSRRRP